MEDIDEAVHELFESEPWPRPGDPVGPFIVVGPVVGDPGEYLADGDAGRVVLRFEHGDPGRGEALERRTSTIVATLRALAHPAFRTVHTGGYLERTVHTGGRMDAVAWIAVAPCGTPLRRWAAQRPWAAAFAVLRQVATILTAVEAAGLDCVTYPDDVRVGPDLCVRIDVGAAMLRCRLVRPTELQDAFSSIAWETLRGGAPPRRRADIVDIPYPRGADLPPWIPGLLERGAYGPPWPSMAALAADFDHPTV